MFRKLFLFCLPGRNKISANISVNISLKNIGQILIVANNPGAAFL